MYFDVETDQRVIHLMGPAKETRDIVVADKQVVVSPGWSIHAGVGTKTTTSTGAWAARTRSIAIWTRWR